MRRLIFAFLAFTWLWGFLALRPAMAGEKVLVTDLEKRRVWIPRNPDRIVCLGPGTLRLICYLKQTRKVVGVEGFEKSNPAGRTYMHAYPELAKLPTVGRGGPAGINKDPDLEAVLKVNPEMIFVANMEAARAEALQEKLGLPVVILSYGGFATFDDVVFDSLRLAGKILKSERRAEELISFIENARQDLLRRTRGLDENQKPRAYIGGIGFRGTQGIESTDASYFPLDWVRARNLAKEIAPKGHLFVDKEKLLAWNPDVIFLDAGGLDLVRQDCRRKPEFYKEMKAFRHKKIHVLFPYNWYVTNIGTAILDAYAAGKILYPSCFTDLHAPRKADEIYHSFLGKPLYQSMAGEFGEIGGTAGLDPH
jgi:iron complex transport system substrate-binding protein